MENSSITAVPELEKNKSLMERIAHLQTEDAMKADVALVWQDKKRVADIAISPEDLEEGTEVDLAARRAAIMADTESILKDLAISYLRKPNDFAEEYGIEEFIIAKDPADLELFRKAKEVIYADTNSDTTAEQAIINELLAVHTEKVADRRLRPAA